VTGYASIATAVEAIKLGADDYLPKPATVPMILRALGEEDDGPADDGEMEVPDAMTPISRLQWEHIQQAMHETGGNVSAAARLLGMHRRSLQRKLAKRPSPERDPTVDAALPAPEPQRFSCARISRVIGSATPHPRPAAPAAGHWPAACPARHRTGRRR
jgi:hypothetical protein